MERLRAPLICAVCLDFLCEPKLLACAHSFCQECLVKVVQKQGLYRTADSSFHENDMECPCCRRPTRLQSLDSDGVKALQTNFNLRELVEIVSNEEKEEIRANLRVRRRGLIAIDHLPIIERLRAELALCQEHGGPLDFFCENCNELACGKCLTKAHKKHDYQHIDDALPKHLDSLRGLVQPACEVACYAKEKMDELLREKKVVTANREKTGRVIEAFFDKMSRALEDRKKALISTLWKYTDIQFTKLDKQSQTLEEAHCAILQIIGNIEHSLQHSEDSSILMEKQSFKDSLDTHRKSILKLTSKPKQSTLFLQFNEDNSLLLALSDLGTLSACSQDPHSNHVSILGQVVVINDDSNICVASDGEMVQCISSTLRCPQSLAVEDPYTEPATFAPSLPPKPTPLTFPPETALNTGSKSSGEDPPQIASDTQTKSISEEPEGECDLDKAALPPLPLSHPPHRSSNNVTEEIPLPPPRGAPSIIDPVKVIPNHQLCSPNSGEQVYPCGVCCTGYFDNVIVTDTFSHCLRLIDHTGEFVEKIGSEGKAGGQFMEPVAITISKDNSIFVAERENTRVQKFTSHGMHLLKFGQAGLFGHQFDDPWAVAVSPDDDVYVSDWGKNRVDVYKPNGKYVRSIGKEGFINFKFPAGIAFDNQGQLLVADRGNHCIWSLAADGTQIMGKIGSGFLHFPYGVSTTPNGIIVVTESGKGRISIFSASGEFIRCFGRSGSEPGMFDHPRHVCINRKGQIIVADEMNQRLQIFELPELSI